MSTGNTDKDRINGYYKSIIIDWRDNLINALSSLETDRQVSSSTSCVTWCDVMSRGVTSHSPPCSDCEETDWTEGLKREHFCGGSQQQT